MLHLIYSGTEGSYQRAYAARTEKGLEELKEIAEAEPGTWEGYFIVDSLGRLVYEPAGAHGEDEARKEELEQ